MKIIKLIVIASLLSAGSVSVGAVDINNATTTAGYSTGVDTNNDGVFVSISHGVSKRLSKGQKTLEGNTSISRSELLPWVEGDVCAHPYSDTTFGAKIFYLSSTAISTLDNGDQIYSQLDPGLENFFCFHPTADKNHAVVNRIFTGGTGQFETACGYTQAVGTTRGIEGLSTFEGVVAGEIFDSSTVEPGTVLGCP